MTGATRRSEFSNWLDPVDEWHAKWLVSYAVRFDISVFRESYRETLRGRYGVDGLQMIEAAIASALIDKPAEFNDLEARVSRLARRLGMVLQGVGKKPRPELKALVACTAPVFLRLGHPLACGSNSRLVEALREVAQQLGVDGDPRGELRRVKAAYIAKTDFAHQTAILSAIAGARPSNEVDCSPGLFTKEE